MALLILLLALLPTPLADTRQPPPGLPPIDPSRAYYDPNLGMWCDANWCAGKDGRGFPLLGALDLR
jgi:hypothetical protein